MKSRVSGKTELIALFGDPVAHSLSPEMHNAAYEALGLDYVYLAFRVPEGSAGDAIVAARTLGMRGFNVTMPHKQAIMKHLDIIDESAELCGAVNTVVNRDGILTGYNTDAAGAVYAVRKLGVSIPDAGAVILGLGGAGRAVLAGLASAGCRRITAAVRNAGRAGVPGSKASGHAEFLEKISGHFGTECRMTDINDDAALYETIRGSDLLINATNLGMGENAGISPVNDVSCFHENLSVMDVIYDPAETKFLGMAREAGVRSAANGLDMLRGQGAEAFRLFTGKELQEENENA